MTIIPILPREPAVMIRFRGGRLQPLETLQCGRPPAIAGASEND
jgi:hypothetical protein